MFNILLIRIIRVAIYSGVVLLLLEFILMPILHNLITGLHEAISRHLLLRQHGTFKLCSKSGSLILSVKSFKLPPIIIALLAEIVLYVL